MQKGLIDTNTLFTLEVVSTRRAQLLKLLEQWLTTTPDAERGVLSIGTPNPEQVVLTRSDLEFRKNIGQLNILLPDGSGLLLASNLFGIRWGSAKLLERIPGIEIAADLLEISAADPAMAVLVVGGRGLGSEIPENWRQRIPGLYLLNPVGVEGGGAIQKAHWYWLEGYADISHPTEEEERLVLSAIGEVKPTIVFVALGAPYQERWLVEHRDELERVGAKIGMVVGGSFDVLTGRLPRAPLWMRQVGLEWLFRLIKQPWRWRRQAALLPFAGYVIKGLFTDPTAPDFFDKKLFSSDEQNTD